MILLAITFIIISLFALFASMGAIFWMFRRDRRVLPAQAWSPSVDREARRLQIGQEVIRFWDLGPEHATQTLVLLHGIGAWSYVWRDLIPLLEDRYRLIVVDLPGFGMSSKNRGSQYNLDHQTEVMSEFIDALALKDIFLIGSSMGGAIALWLGMKRPEKFRGVLAISPSINGMRYWIPFYIPLFLVRLLAFVATRFLFKLIMKNVISSHQRIDDELISEYWRPFALDSESVVTFIKGLRVVYDRRLPYALSGLDAHLPIHVLWGRGDRVTPFRDHKLLARYLPQAKYFSHETAGHHVMEDAPAWCAEKITDFLTSTPSKSTKIRKLDSP
jgi:pimeloyl-ACP methyl ester carboxylesterase